MVGRKCSWRVNWVFDVDEAGKLDAGGTGKEEGGVAARARMLLMVPSCGWTTVVVRSTSNQL